MTRIPGLYRRGSVWWFAGVITALVLIGTPMALMAAMNIDTALVERSIVFIVYSVRDERGQERQSVGTGFLVGVPRKSDPSNPHRLLVTARHVIDPMWKGCNDTNPAQVILRLNLKQPMPDGTAFAPVTIDLVKGGKPTYETGQKRDDVAVLQLPAALNLTDYDVSLLPLSLFATRAEMQGLAISDSVVSAGLLPAFAGVKRNYPIFKFGNISNVPRESVSVPCRDREGRPRADGDGAPLKNDADLWLLAITLVGGSSGSPVFSVPPGARGGSGGVTFSTQMGFGREMVIGVQSMAFDGTGVAGMTPIGPLFDAVSRMNLADADLYRGAPRRR